MQPLAFNWVTLPLAAALVLTEVFLKFRRDSVGFMGVELAAQQFWSCERYPGRRDLLQHRRSTFKVCFEDARDLCQLTFPTNFVQNSDHDARGGVGRATVFPACFVCACMCNCNRDAPKPFGFVARAHAKTGVSLD